MWPFQPKPAPTVDRPLEERVRKLESLVRQQDADLNDLFDRFQRLQGRRAKREAREDLQSMVEETPEEQINRRIREINAGITRREN